MMGGGLFGLLTAFQKGDVPEAFNQVNQFCYGQLSNFY
jgi:hypothetical protein